MLIIDNIIMLVISIRLGFVQRFQESAEYAIVVDISVTTGNAFKTLPSCRSIGQINICIPRKYSTVVQVTHGRG